MINETKKKSLENLYELFNNHYIRLKKQYEKELQSETYYDFVYNNSYIKQQLLDYEVSIYKNIKNKLIPFTEIFDLKNNNPYILNDFESEVLRTYIGIYNDGKKQSKKEISKIFNVSPSKIDRTLNIIISDFLYPTYQQQFLQERNQLIKDNLKNNSFKEVILKLDINFLTMTQNLEEILRNININTIEDILNIDIKTILDMNIEYGYNTNLRLFPTRIIDEIHELGLTFKSEKLLEEIAEAYMPLQITTEEEIDIQEHVMNIETVLDLLLAQQFEPEILDTMDLNERLKVDRLINNNNIQNQYVRISQEISEQTIKLIQNNRIIYTPEQIIERNFPYMVPEEIEAIKEEINPFKIINKTTEEQQEFIKIYSKDKN